MAGERRFCYTLCVILGVTYAILILMGNTKDHHAGTRPRLSDVIRSFLSHMRSTSRLAPYIDRPLAEDPDDTFSCMNTTVSTVQTPGQEGGKLTYPICLYEPDQDVHISRAIIEGRGWEGGALSRILRELQQGGPEVGFIDVGANIGVYTLAAAAAGHQVVAVEAMASTFRRLQRAVELGKVKDRVTLVQAAVSNDTGDLYYMVNRDNKGGSGLCPLEKCYTDKIYYCDKNHVIPAVYMDDLLEVVTFRRGVMKMDIEGFELHAFQKSEKFLSQVEIYYIMMEFRFYILMRKESKIIEAVNRFLKYMKNFGYMPYTLEDKPLSEIPWTKWTDDIIWIRN